MNKPKHGGQREGAGPPRKMKEPIRVTLLLETKHFDQLKTRYGRNWQEKVRALIAKHLT